ncbi:MAG: response regulator [candidate division Zixibacteria bacterium]|nr:response regulator [candidate division Zixibacteria bacterium]
MERKINILVVDDEQIILDSIEKHLRKENYNVRTALSVGEAQRLMEEIRFDIFLTDLMMPDIDGMEFMRMVKLDQPRVPVIMITGYATINTALQAKQLGAFDYIAKPFTKKELMGVIRRAAELVAGAGSASGENDEYTTDADHKAGPIKSIGDQSWMMQEENGVVLLGVERSFLNTIGKIQMINLPSKGDRLRQGGTYLQIFSTDLRSHTVLSPLSGMVVEVNQKVVDNPNSALQDPYGEGWLIRLEPSKFEFERKLLGL